MTPLHRQLSLDVELHPRLRDLDEPYLTASLKVGGSFHVTQDLQPGDRLTVTIADADGEVIATSLAEVGGVAFAPITDRGTVIGTERAHKAKVTAS